MKKIFVALGLLLALCSAASAQWFPMASGPTGAAPAYTGPGDIVASATAWYGLRAYNAAIVTTGTQALVNLRRSSDNHTCDKHEACCIADTSRVRTDRNLRNRKQHIQFAR